MSAVGEAVSAPPGPASAGVSRGLFILVLAIAVASLMLAGMSWRNERALESDLSQRPPIAVIAVNDALNKAAQSGATGAVDRAAMRVELAGKRLRAQGYVVLDGDHLVAYPKELKVQLDAGSDGDDAGDTP